jgi:hypothetical protein
VAALEVSLARYWRVVASSMPEVVGFIGPVYKMLDGVHVADLGENPRFWSLAGAGDGDISYIFESIIEVMLTDPSAILREKP